jgi:hypothetical protein
MKVFVFVEKNPLIPDAHRKANIYPPTAGCASDRTTEPKEKIQRTLKRTLSSLSPCSGPKHRPSQARGSGHKFSLFDRPPLPERRQFTGFLGIGDASRTPLH